MPATHLAFDRFVLEPADRQLTAGGTPIELNARYLDALILLVREAGQLITKDRFLGEVWRGVPVTDEALTQCIKTLRRQLGDDAAAPRFIETVPKHGYRFIAPVEAAAATALPAPTATAPASRVGAFVRTGIAGTLGAAAAGLLGGIAYGLAGASSPAAMGALSALLVLTALTIVIALVGGAGVSFGIALAGLAASRLWQHVAGGAFGGLLVGAVVKLLGLDAFNLLFGHSPGNITGAAEGALLGGTIGAGAWLARRFGSGSLSLCLAIAAAAGATAGIVVPLLGGHMLGGSLALLAQHFPDSRLGIGAIGKLFGEADFGPLAQLVTGALEGALFGAGVIGAMMLAEPPVQPGFASRQNRDSLL
ncbi:MAG: winged helix-turn-helix domain-containing protein [Pseudomonadota bacterium]